MRGSNKIRTTPNIEKGKEGFCNQFARAFTDICRESGQSVGEVCRRANIPPRKVYRMASRDIHPYTSFAFFERLAKAIDLDIMDFIIIQVPKVKPKDKSI